MPDPAISSTDWWPPFRSNEQVGFVRTPAAARQELNPVASDGRADGDFLRIRITHGPPGTARSWGNAGRRIVTWFLFPRLGMADARHGSKGSPAQQPGLAERIRLGGPGARGAPRAGTRARSTRRLGIASGIALRRSGACAGLARRRGELGILNDHPNPAYIRAIPGRVTLMP